MMMQHMQRSQSANMSSAQNNIVVVLHPDFQLQKNRYIKNEDHEDDSRSFFNTCPDKKNPLIALQTLLPLPLPLRKVIV